MSWNYKVPRFAGSRWEAEGFKAIGDGSPEDPRIGIFCDINGHEDFLIGMCRRVEEGSVSWWESWSTYPTGEGQLIELHASSDIPSSLILNDKPRPDTIPSDTDTSTERTRYKLRCRTCRNRRAFNFESLQVPLTMLWDGGIREISLQGLARSVETLRA